DVTGDFTMKLYPTDQHLLLKAGAQVVLLRNDPERRFVNGTIGTILHMSDEMILLRILNGDGNDEEIELYPFEWELIQYDYDRNTGTLTPKVTGTFRQFPIKLAWAITIHKSQGKTFDRA